MTLPLFEAPGDPVTLALARTSAFPRLRYMGSKYKLLAYLASTFAEVGGTTALDAFSGSGVVSYLLKAQGFAVTSNDFLAFPTAITTATVVNHTELLTSEDVEHICSPSADGRDFIERTFSGIYFTPEDLRFLDSAWSHIDTMEGPKRALAISALVLSAARKQPRGVFTFASLRYDDGRRDLHLPLSEHFRERVAEYNGVVFDSGEPCEATSLDVFDIPRPERFDVVYLDPPYAPAKDDNCYVKRYHFLEGLSAYWQGMEVMEDTVTKKLPKRFTPFSYKRTIEDALARTFDKFRESTIVLSYSSNAVPDAETILRLLGEVKDQVEVKHIDHKYSFGTHATATRRDVQEYVFVGRDHG